MEEETSSKKGLTTHYSIGQREELCNSTEYVYFSTAKYHILNAQ